jgi:hypothetical protein
MGVWMKMDAAARAGVCPWPGELTNQLDAVALPRAPWLFLAAEAA